MPYSIHRMQPVIYVGSGVLTIVFLPNIFGILSGLLLICAGVLVVVWRNEKTTKRRKRQPAPQGTNRTKRTANMRYATDPGEPDKTRASILTSEQNEFSTTENTWRDGEQSDSVQFSLYHIEDGAPVTGSLLSRFSPFNEFNDALKENFARGLVVSRKPAGSVLIKRESKDDASIFLIEGTLVLKAADGKKTRVVAGTRAALFPLCQLRPHIYSAIATTEVAVIILRQTLLRDVTIVVTEHKNAPGIQVSHLRKA